MSLKKVLNDMDFDYVINCGGYVEHKKKKEVEESHFKGAKIYTFYLRIKN